MPRDASGNYTLPNSNPVVTGTIIESDWANQTMGDIANVITDSLSRNGEGGMLAPLKIVNGTEFLPSLTFLNDVQTGLYLNAVNEMYASVGTVPLMRWTAAGVEVWNVTDSVWVLLGAAATGANTFAGPDPTLANATAAIIIGTDDADLNPHIAGGPTTLQAKADGTTAADIEINPLGGDLSLGAQSGTGGTLIYQDGDLRASFDTGPFPVGMVLTNDGTNGIVLNDAANAVQQGFMGVLGGTVQVNNYTAGAPCVFNATQADTTQVEMMQFLPNAYSAGQAVYAPRLNLTEYYSGDDVPNYGPPLAFTGGAYTTIMASDYISAGGDFKINPFGGGNVVLGPSDSGTGNVQLWQGGDQVAITDTPENGGLFVNNLNTGSGYGRVLTEDDLGTSALQFGSVANPSLYFIGDTDTGLFRENGNELGIACGGLLSCTFVSNGIKNGNGSSTNPAYSFDANILAGMYYDAGAAEVGVSSSSPTAIRWETTTPAAGGLLVNNTLTGAGLERVLTASDIGGGTPPVVAGFSGSLYSYIADGVTSGALFDVFTALTESTFETVGPTSSGATNIWTALDIVPSTATSIILQVTLQIDPDWIDLDATMSLYAHRTAGAISASNLVAQVSAFNDSSETFTDPVGITVQVTVPCNSSQVMRLAWQQDNETAGGVCEIRLVGFNA